MGENNWASINPLGEVTPSSPKTGEILTRVNPLGNSEPLPDSDAKLVWEQQADALVIQPVKTWPCQHAVVVKIQLLK